MGHGHSQNRADPERTHMLRKCCVGTRSRLQAITHGTNKYHEKVVRILSDIAHAQNIQGRKIQLLPSDMPKTNIVDALPRQVMAKRKFLDKRTILTNGKGALGVETKLETVGPNSKVMPDPNLQLQPCAGGQV